MAAVAMNNDENPTANSNRILPPTATSSCLKRPSSSSSIVEQTSCSSTNNEVVEDCWKCHGHGRKYLKTEQAYVGTKCGVCQGKGKRLPSRKAQELRTRPGKIIPLRGKNGAFVGPRAVGSITNVSLQPGELLAALGCGDWRLYQLAYGHKLTVDDFLCAWVAAVEMRKKLHRSDENAEAVSEASSQLPPFGTIPSSDKEKTIPSFRHADLGCGCGSVLMTLAWAFPNCIQSYGIEAQEVSYHLCRQGLLFNLGVDGTTSTTTTTPHPVVTLDHGDMRTWTGHGAAPFHLITGTPPYFPTDRFVKSPNASQKVECRVPTRGAARDYVEAASRLLLLDEGLFVMVESARTEAEQAVWQAVDDFGMTVQRRLDVITRTGLPPRFSVWVMTKASSSSSSSCASKNEEKPSRIISKKETADRRTRNVTIETLILRNKDQTRTLEYVDAMEEMGWVDFMNTRQNIAEPEQDGIDAQAKEAKES